MVLYLSRTEETGRIVTIEDQEQLLVLKALEKMENEEKKARGEQIAPEEDLEEVKHSFYFSIFLFLYFLTNSSAT